MTHATSSIRHTLALVSRINKTIDLFCKRTLQKKQYSSEETHNFIDPPDRSHRIETYDTLVTWHMVLEIHDTYCCSYTTGSAKATRRITLELHDTAATWHIVEIYNTSCYNHTTHSHTTHIAPRKTSPDSILYDCYDTEC